MITGCLSLQGVRITLSNICAKTSMKKAFFDVKMTGWILSWTKYYMLISFFLNIQVIRIITDCYFSCNIFVNATSCLL